MISPSPSSKGSSHTTSISRVLLCFLDVGSSFLFFSGDPPHIFGCVIGVQIQIQYLGECRAFQRNCSKGGAVGRNPEEEAEMIEVVLNDRLGKKVQVKCNEDDTIGDLKKLVATQTGTLADKIRIQKWYNIYKDHIEFFDEARRWRKPILDARKVMFQKLDDEVRAREFLFSSKKCEKRLMEESLKKVQSIKQGSVVEVAWKTRRCLAMLGDVAKAVGLAQNHVTFVSIISLCSDLATLGREVKFMHRSMLNLTMLF